MDFTEIPDAEDMMASLYNVLDYYESMDKATMVLVLKEMVKQIEEEIALEDE